MKIRIETKSSVQRLSLQGYPSTQYILGMKIISNQGNSSESLTMLAVSPEEYDSLSVGQVLELK